jgi:hypothetical protein
MIGTIGTVRGECSEKLSNGDIYMIGGGERELEVRSSVISSPHGGIQ